jgi:hypothetical protein
VPQLRHRPVVLLRQGTSAGCCPGTLRSCRSQTATQCPKGSKPLGWGTDTGCRARSRLRSKPVEPDRLAPAKGCLLCLHHLP